jgi:hypothetical protein
VLQLADQVVYEISDLLDGAWATGGYGAMLDAVTKLLGGDGTIMRMKPNSVTKAKAVINALIQGKGATNNYSVLRLGGHQVGFEWGNTRLEWTDQGALVNGALIYYSTKADIHDNEIIAFKGTASSPPGELFGMNDVHGDNNRYRGNAINGRGQGASGFGANSSKNPITIGGISENNPIAAGYTHYRTTGAEYHYSRSYGNKVGYNFEMGSGPVILDHVDLRGISGADFIFDHTDASAKIQIIEPSTDSADGSFDVLIHKNYIDAGIAYPVKQLQSDVTLIKNGVQRPDLLKFRTA